MNARAIILQSESLGIRLYLKDGSLAIKSPKGRLTPEFRAQIVANKAQIIQLLSQELPQQLPTDSHQQPISKRDLDEHPQLSFAQQRLWFIDKLESGSSQYNIPVALKVDGAFNLTAAQQAFERIITRHEALRTVFREYESGPIQLIQPSFDFTIERVDLTSLDDSVQKQKLPQIITDESNKAFDLQADLMLRVSYVELSTIAGAEQGVLLVNMHHIASDGWSLGILVKEFVAQYQAAVNGQPDPLAPLPIQYADYALWQRQWLTGDVMTAQLAYWAKQLDDVPVVHSLPLDYPRPTIKQSTGQVVSASLGIPLSKRLQDVANAHDITPFMLLHGALALLLSRHSNSNDIVIGTPVANRTRVELEPLIGYFANTLVLRVDTGHQNLADYFAHIRQVHLDAQSNQQVPFEQLVEQCQLPRTTQHNPLVQIMFSMDISESTAMTLPGLQFSPLASDTTAVKFDLDISAQISDEGIHVSWVFDQSIFSQSRIHTLNDHFSRLLNAIAELPTEASGELKALSMLSAEEYQQLVFEINQPQIGAEQNVETTHFIHQLFERQAAATPQKLAVVFDDPSCEQGPSYRELSYQQLNQRANQLAHYLIEQGVGPETLVGICVPRSVEMVIGVLAILKAGGAYVPLDPNYPKARLDFMLEDSGIKLLVTQAELADKLVLPADIQLVDCDGAQYQHYAVTNPQRSDQHSPKSSPSDLAYVIYTSGSTGQPKGVLQTHENVARLFVAAEQNFDFCQQDVWSVFHSIAFDFSVWELWGGLFYGGTAVIVSNECARDPQQFVALCAKHKVTVLNQTPGAFKAFSSAAIQQQADLPALRYVIFGGETLNIDHVAPWWQRYGDTQPQLVNMYGITETTVFSSFKNLNQQQMTAQAGSSVIGQRLAHQRLYLLDSAGVPVPAGAIGELYIGGAGLARGYLNRPQLTAERFIDDPFSSNTNDRLYKTGDLLRYLTDEQGNPSELVYIGRIDEQVKIRGFRIELGEIEYQISECDNVDSVVVLVREDEPSQKRLVAYVVAGCDVSDEVSFIEQLLQALQQRLPSHMVPAAFVLMPQLPLTANGKVDKKALPAPDSHQSQGQYVAPATDSEKALVAIWAQLLKLDAERLSVNADFFRSGGHSLLAVQLLTQIRVQLGIELAIKAIFEHPTISGLAAYIDAGLGGEKEPQQLSPAITRVERQVGQPIAVSFAQQGLWFIDRLQGSSTQYNMPAALLVSGALDVTAAELALNRIISRHESLRTVFIEHDHQPMQIIQEAFDFKLSCHDLSSLSHEAQQQSINQHIVSDNAKAFDLTRDLMVRASYLHLAKQDQDTQEQGVLIFNMHHIASDGWSMDLLCQEFISQYEAAVKGQPDPLPELSIQYADYALWQRQSLSGEALSEQLDYWSQQLAEVPAVHSLTLDQPRTEIKQKTGKMVLGQLAADLTERLQQVATQHEITMFMLLHGALALLLSRHSNSHDIVIGTPVANRTKAELEPLIGFFANTLALRVDTEQPNLAEFFAHVRQINLDAQSNQQVPFEQVVELCQLPADSRYNPLVQITFTLAVEQPAELTIPGLSFSPLTSTAAAVKFDLEVSAQISEAGTQLCWIYDTSLFSERRIQQLNDHLSCLLGAIAELSTERATEQSADTALTELSMLSAEEYQQLVFEINETQNSAETTDFIHQLFERQAAATPQKLAVVFDDPFGDKESSSRELSYQQLNQRANQMAHYLKQQGVGADTLVGICLPRSAEMVIAILAILKAGGAYVPLDPNYPKARLDFMLKDSGIKLLVSQAEVADKLALEQVLPDDILLVDCDDAQYQDYAVTNLPCSQQQSPSDLAYVIYTSGSTGQPKGVLQTHENVTRLFAATEESFDFCQHDVWSLFHSIAFDFSVWELWGGLFYGGTVVIVSNECARDPQQFVALCAQHKVTVLNQTPGAFKAFTGAAIQQQADLPTLRYVIFGGEALNLDHVAPWWQHYGDTQAQLVNMYGITETTVHASFKALDQQSMTAQAGLSVIGQRLAHQQLYLLDSTGLPVPAGATGELYIGGGGLARGYLNQPQLTAERFIANPFSNNSNDRLYKTGDLLRYLLDEQGNPSELVYMGRIDDQVKIRGFRIELGEIEHQLSSCDKVASAVVLVREDLPDHKSLVAYVVAACDVSDAAAPNQHELSEHEFIDELHQTLQQRLPSHMVPAAFVLMPQLPLTANGKVDKKALPAPDSKQQQGQYVAPATDSETALQAIWAQLLKLDVEDLSVNADFFRSGGQSLLAVQLIAQIRLQLGLELAIKTIFDYPTIRGLAALIDRDNDRDNDRELADANLSQLPSAARGAITAVERQTDEPVISSFAQQRLWFIDQLNGPSALYNMPGALKVEGHFDVDIAEQALVAIINRHETLRTVFKANQDNTGNQDNAVQCIRPTFEFSLIRHDLTVDVSADLKEQQQQTIEAITQEFNQSCFDLSHDLMIRVSYLQLAADKGILLFNLHHIASDGWSMTVLFKEFVELYQALRDGHSQSLSHSLAPLNIQYADYAIWQRQWLSAEVSDSQLNYWTRQLAQAPAVHSLPLCFERPIVKGAAGAMVTEHLDSETAEQLKQLAHQHQLTPFMLLHGALARVIGEHSYSTDIVIGTPVANRMQAELEPLIGFFVNTLVLRVDTEYHNLADYFGHVRTVHLEAQSHQDIPFEQLVEHCQVPRSTAHSPLFQIMFAQAVQSENDKDLAIEGVRFETLTSNDIQVKFDLDISFDITAQGITFSWVYDTALFTKAVIERLAAHLNQLLTSMAQAFASNAINNTASIDFNQLSMLSDEEIHYLISTLNQTGNQTADQQQQNDFSEQRVDQMLAEQARKTPDHIALIVEDSAGRTQTLSYQALDRAANQLAHYLQAQGVGAQTLVGVCTPRNFDMIIAIFAVLKAGGAYVPMDPEYPKARLAYIFQDTGLKHLLTHSEAVSSLDFSGLSADVSLIVMDDEAMQQTLTGYATTPPERPSASLSNDLAYIIYTSGSTGQPKGVMIEHPALVNSTVARYSRYQSPGCFLLLSSVAFDSSVVGIFHTLLTGGSLCLAKDLLLNNAAQVAQQIQRHQVTHLLTTPSLYAVLVDEFDKVDLTALTTVVVAGEECSRELVLKHYQYHEKAGHSVDLFNEYGPTEATVWSSGCQLYPDKAISIGRPIDNVQLYILNAQQQLVPQGAIGELYIGGAGLARGYFNQPELTAQKFMTLSITHAFNSPESKREQSQRLYRTGDLVRYLPDGQLAFIGRADDQVKIRGFRIEPGEIEKQLVNCDGINEAVVLAVDDAAGNKRLVAYVVGAQIILEQFKPQLRQQLQQRLPEYMLPSVFVLLEQLPLTPNGKVDKKALLASTELSNQLASDAEYVAPVGDNERALVKIWAELLKQPEHSLSVEADFFALGGHSLLAVRLVADIRRQFEQELAIKAIFDSPTIRTLAAQIDSGFQAPLRTSVTAVERQPNQALPTSFAQQRLWFIDHLQGDSSEYNMPSALKVEGDFDVTAAEKAITDIIRRHESLRTVFQADGATAMQLIQSEFEFSLNQLDLTDLTGDALQQKVTQLMVEDSLKAFDLSQDLMLRVSYLQLANQHQGSAKQTGVLLFNMHHIASDGWSMTVLLKEFVAHYQHIVKSFGEGSHTDSAPLPPLAIQYADYALWQRNWFVGEVFEAQASYWTKQLADMPAVHNLPLDHPRPQRKSHQGAQVISIVNGETSGRLMQLATAHQLTPFMLLHGALALVLSRHSNSHDIVIGTPVANRLQSELAPLIGFFANTLVLRADTRHETLSDYLLHIKALHLDAQAHQDMPFEQLVELCKVTRSNQHSPLFQILFTINNNEQTPLALDGVEFTPMLEAHQVAKFDLDISATIIEKGNNHGQNKGIQFSWVYDTSLFSQSHIETIAKHLNTLLEAMAAVVADKVVDSKEQDDTRLHQLAMLSEQEIEQQLHQFNDTQVTFPEAQMLIHELFEAKALQMPTQTAIQFENQSLDYQALNHGANRLAYYLQSWLKSKPNRLEVDKQQQPLIGLCLERSIDMVIAMLAIVKAGGAYVPLDPALPQSRIDYVLDNTNMPMVLTTTAFSGRFAAVHSVCIDDIGFSEQLQQYPTDNFGKIDGLNTDALAYVIYTSGSTGYPKGVMIEHRALVNRVAWMQSEYQLSAQDKVLQKTPYTFDVSVWEFMWTLAYGGTLVMASPGRHGDPVYLSQLIAQQQITRLHFVPSMLKAYLEHLKHAAINQGLASCIKDIFCSGEALDIQEALWVKNHAPHVRLHNLYGPTEAAIDVSYFDTRQLNTSGTQSSVPIGKPISNINLYVLDEHQQLLPLGSVGELHIGGVGLARGYVNQSQLTDEKFIRHPFSANQQDRIYKTGDLVRLLSDGNIEYLGRTDSQVKLRGFRIELSEIEYQLNQVEGITSSIVLLRSLEPDNSLEQGSSLEPEQLLTAYVVSNSRFLMNDQQIIEQLREALQQTLPDYMQPDAYVVMDAFELTANGKVNKKALPMPDLVSCSGQYVAPNSETEKVLASIWANQLQLNEQDVSATANFFELGGHSLLAVKLIAEIRDRMNKELPLQVFFDTNSLAELATALDGIEVQATRTLVTPVAADEQQGPTPLSFAQQRLWFIDQIDGGTAQYNMPCALAVEGNFDINVAEQTFVKIIERHQSLRTVFVEHQGAPTQKVQQSVDFSLVKTDLTQVSGESQQQQLAQIIQAHKDKIFDLSNDLMIRGAYVLLSHGSEQAPQRGILLLNMHHIASDGWSIGVLINEFVKIYQALCDGTMDSIEPLAIQYTDYTWWQRNWLEGEVLDSQLDYWQQQMQGAPSVHGLPLDYPRPAVKGYDGAMIRTQLPQAVSDQLIALARQFDVTPFMLLHGALALVISKNSYSHDIVIGTPVANRLQSELEPLIGFFANTLVLRTNTDFADFAAYIDHVRQVNLDAQANQEVPFEHLVEHLRVPRNPQHTPVFQIMFTVNNNKTEELKLPEVEFTVMANDERTAKFDLIVSADIYPQGMHFHWNYDKDLFTEQRISQFSQHFTTLLTSLTEAAALTAPLHRLNMLSDKERHDLLVRHETSGLDPENHTLYQPDLYKRENQVPGVHQLFEQQCRKTPDAIAIDDGNTRLRYIELEHKANQLAHYLAEKGLKAGSAAGVCMGRNVNVVISTLAILKTGAAYVPMDHTYPVNRLMYIVQDSAIELLLCDQASPSIPEQTLQLVDVDQLNVQAYSTTPLALETPVSGDDLCYLIYTSGSTGKPKGVMMPHHVLVNLVVTMPAQCQLLAQPLRMVQYASAGFDMCFTDIFVTLATGGSLRLIDEQLQHDLPALLELLQELKIERLNLPYAVLHQLAVLTVAGELHLPHLKVIISTAEQLRITTEIRQFFSRHNQCALVNHYGPSETHVVTGQLLSPDVESWPDIPSIGQLLPNIQGLVLDQHQQLVPYGATGELHIAEGGIADGYLNRDDLTLERFVPNPFVSGERLYKTSDLVRFLPDGSLEYLGRADNQVKIHGFRIEPGEIEHQLCELEGVHSAVVVVQNVASHEHYLAAYIVVEQQVSIELNGDDNRIASWTRELKQQLQQTLPQHMIPAAMMVLPQLPLTANGKVDKSALPAIDRIRLQGAYVPPEGETQQALAAIWADILKLPPTDISAAANFFELGGHSLLCVKLVADIKQRLFVDMHIRSVYEAGDLVTLAEKIDGQRTLQAIESQKAQKVIISKGTL